MEKEFLVKIPKAHKIKVKIEKLDCIKLTSSAQQRKQSSD
jgi:hypothetical protein